MLPWGRDIHLNWGLKMSTGCPNEGRWESEKGFLGLGNSSVQRPGDDRLPHTNLGLQRLQPADPWGGKETEGVIKREKSLGAREIFTELIQGLPKSFNNMDTSTVDLVGAQKIILDDENERVMKINLFNNINYILELCHKLALALKGKYRSEIWLSHGHVDFSQGRWSFRNFTITWD